MASARRIKSTLPGTTQPGNMSGFELLLGGKLRTTLDTLVPHDTKLSGGLDAFIKKRRNQMLREVTQVVERRDSDKVVTRLEVNVWIARPSAGVSVQSEDSVPVRESCSHIHRDSDKGKLHHDRWIGLWSVSKVLQRDLILKVVMDGR